MTLDDDPRWQRFNDTSYACACCGRSFGGVFDIGFDHPAPWPHGNRSDAGVEIMEIGGDSLSQDICKLGEHRFLRAVLKLPVIGSDQVFAFGPWASVAPHNFDTYMRHEATASLNRFEGCFAWMMNFLPGFEITDWLPCNLLIDDPEERPFLEVHDGSHDLARLQEEGITFDRLLDIYAASGNDIRPHLIDG